MKTKLFALLVLIIGASCSAPKQAYYFGYHDYQAGKRAAQKLEQLTVTSNEVVASTNTAVAPTVIEQSTSVPVEANKDVVSTTPAEHKTFMKEVKKDIKAAVKKVKKMNTIQSTQSMDHDLKLAAIFGAIGIVLGALFSVNNIIGFIGFVSIVIALVFLVKWLMRQ